MAILPGTRLGPYEVLSAIGAGGMGEVYRAQDKRLNRDVALKVVPDAFAADSERMARFEREAKLLASLNHPHIAAIYGIEESGATNALVMEFVEGPTLADRIASGPFATQGKPIPFDEALPIAKQIAEALEYAHDHNVIHRDLKPANIKVKPDGTVKVLDFGLAKAMLDDPTAIDMSNSPTLSMAATMAGTILGTAAYMSPEQAKGKPADRRADIWAFGVVLFEMLTGKQLYSGETAADILAFVITKDPPFDMLPAKTPPAVRTLLRRCLTKDVRQRLQHIGEARVTLEHAKAASGEPVATRRRSRKLLLSIAAAITIVLAALGWGAFVYLRRAPQSTQPVRFFLSPPGSGQLAMTASTASGANVSPLAVSPDGRYIAIVVAGTDGKSQIWIRSLDTLAAQELAGTEGAFQPFWSPDSRFIAFFADGKLKKIEVSGGPPISLCDAPDPRAGTWNRDGAIVFSPTPTSVLQRVSAAGGVTTPVSSLRKDETVHMRPFFLPDGQHFLYRPSIGPGGGPTYVGSLKSMERKFLFNADSSNVLYSQGHVLFLRESTLMAQPFDAKRLELTGDAFPIAENIRDSGTVNPSGVFSVSENGVLIYQTGTAAAGNKLLWFDRGGKQTGVLGDPELYSDLELSPDEKRISFTMLDPSRKGTDIWLYDLARGLRTRFTFGPGPAYTSIWSPDNSRILFNANRKGHLDLYLKPSSGAGAEEAVLEDNLDKFPASWSPDGRFILYRTGGGQTHTELFLLAFAGDRKPVPFLNSKFEESFGQFSPDGRWVAYRSNESGKSEIYVVPFPGPGGKWQISTTGGDRPRWRRDGSEIFYIAPDNTLMAASVNGKGASFEVGSVKPLFATGAVVGTRYQYAVAGGGQRFLINTAPVTVASAPITVVLNWTEGLKK